MQMCSVYLRTKRLLAAVLHWKEEQSKQELKGGGVFHGVLQPFGDGGLAASVVLYIILQLHPSQHLK